MPSLTCFNVRFTPSWLMIFLTLLFGGLFVRLGFWQIQRAEQKQQMVQADALLAKKEPIQWRSQSKFPLQYQRVKVTGRYLQDVFLLDNQHQQHQFGYDVLSPLLLDDGTVVLIDRGWLAGESTRRTFPKVSTPTDFRIVQGSAYFPSKNQWVLGPDIEKKSAQLTIIEKLDAKTVSQILQKKVYPFIIRLDKEDEHGFIREWAIVSMPPQRHLAYAWQWFAMAFVIFIIFLALNLKKNDKTII
jgi:surfeit locus 1 family protein